MNELIDLLSKLPVGGLGFGGIVSLAIILIFKGEIVPKSTVDAMRTDRDAIIAEKNDQNNMLKEAYKLSEQARLTGAEADKELLEMAHITVHLLESIHERAQRVDRAEV